MLNAFSSLAQIKHFYLKCIWSTSITTYFYVHQVLKRQASKDPKSKNNSVKDNKMTTHTVQSIRI